jgi:multidrug efflux system membrane fusion protein
VLFSMPQQDVNRINAAFAKGSLAVEALAADNKTVTDRGTLQVVDNQVDPTTGTVKLKAEFPNADLQQWPGQFINVRLIIDLLKDAVVVPTAAVQRGPNGAFVYVIDGGTAKLRNVRVAQQDETLAVIVSGLDGTEQVVTSGFARLTDGAPIALGQPDATAQPGAGRQPQQQRPQGAPQSRRRNGDGARTEGTANTKP